MNASCKLCGAPAGITQGNITRTCTHTDVGVSVDLSATCYGDAEVNGPPNRRDFLTVLRTLLARIKRA